LADRHQRLFESVATVLLALATVATAWSGYQASRWHGKQAVAFSTANATRIESARSAGVANRQIQIDVATFIQFVDAYATGESELAAFYRARFRPEFKPAVEAWIATEPLKTEGAPQTPFAMPEYTLAESTRSEELDRTATAAAALARVDIQRADNYVLCAVLFAAVLFFAGFATRLQGQGPRLAVLGIGAAMFVGTLVWMATFPISVGV
jgi:hypothetical protein